MNHDQCGKKIDPRDTVLKSGFRDHELGDDGHR